MSLTEMGQAVRDARRLLRLSQAALAQELGMSRATLSAFETGKINELGIRKVMLICMRVGLEMSVAPRRQYPTLQELRRSRNGQKA